jgi:hypothetical protein
VKPEPIVRELTPLAGFLSYLVPGLGQIYQGRIAKGVLFLVCIYTLFFYGTYLSYGMGVDNEGRTYRVTGNVYLPDSAARDAKPSAAPRWLSNLYNRPQFAGQFWVGVVVWPAIWQYLSLDEAAVAAARAELDTKRKLAQEAMAAKKKAEEDKQADEAERKAADAARLTRQADELEKELERGDPIFGQFQRTPSEKAKNAVETMGDKRMDLGWVYTVIAGVLNVMVIYDALAGPAFLPTKPEPSATEAAA